MGGFRGVGVNIGAWGVKFPILGKIADEVFLNCLDLKNISMYVGGTSVVHGIGAYYRILMRRPYYGSFPITRDGDGPPEPVVCLFI